MSLGMMVSNTLGVNGAQVCILKHANKVSLRSLLEGKYSCALEMQVAIEILSNLSYQTLEWRLAKQSKGQPTFGISGSLEAVIERNEIPNWAR
jgi:hypothetical protein